ncbi:MAG: hypothetical protein HRT89_10990, partial [Lentisphaeria bacterium]|nr:hypothetical protein [Lentisphaeria bacterium]
MKKKTYSSYLYTKENKIKAVRTVSKSGLEKVPSTIVKTEQTRAINARRRELVKSTLSVIEGKKIIKTNKLPVDMHKFIQGKWFFDADKTPNISIYKNEKTPTLKQIYNDYRKSYY